ncbi:MAG: hypothetical protein NXI21_17565 [Alphaproteobacteria bacterium]|nr:hypothetical protein [Alphaproteobacteria bacterium]
MVDWSELAQRLEGLHADLWRAAESVSDVDEAQLVQLEAISIRHMAHHMHYIAESADK